MAAWPVSGPDPASGHERNANGTRPHHHYGREAAQPQERHRGDPEEEARDLHGGLGLGQVEPRLRHPLRRGPAPLHREPERLRPAVPRADGQAGLRLDPRPRPHHLHRAEGRVRQPPLHGGHGHRDPRLPARALGAGGQAHLLQLRAAGVPAVEPADRGRGRLPARGHQVPAPRPPREGAQGRAPRRDRVRAQGGLHPACGWTASCCPSRTRSASTRRRSTRSTRWSTASWPSPT